MINPCPDYPTSKQDAFDRVWQWFVVEKHPPGVNASGWCAYRGAGGCMCGIGVMVPDADMPENVSDTIHDLLHGKYPFALKLLTRVEDDRQFLELVQSAHDESTDDCGDFDSLIESKLRSVAETFNLSVPSNEGTP